MATPPSKTVLVVDDDVDSADALGLLLRTWGAITLVAYDAATALNIARSTDVDVALIDIVMPDMDGFALLKAIQDNHLCSKTLLVAVSGHCTDSDRRRSRDAGFHLHIDKPCEAAEIYRIFLHSDEYLASITQTRSSAHGS